MKCSDYSKKWKRCDYKSQRLNFLSHTHSLYPRKLIGAKALRNLTNLRRGSPQPLQPNDLIAVTISSQPVFSNASLPDLVSRVASSTFSFVDHNGWKSRPSWLILPLLPRLDDNVIRQSDVFSSVLHRSRRVTAFQVGVFGLAQLTDISRLAIDSSTSTPRYLIAWLLAP